MDDTTRSAADARRVRPAGLPGPFRKLRNYFLSGVALLAPLAVTGWVLYTAFATIDRWLGLPWPGAGFGITIVLVTLFGFVASHVIATQAVAILDGLMARVPLVRLVYGSTKDLLAAFVGEKRRFKSPVIVTLFPGGTVRCLGFITQESLAALRQPGHVAVYLPQGYAFAGNLYLVPTEQVQHLDADPAEVMAFVVSGGVTAIPLPTGTPAAGIPSVRTPAR